MMYETGNHNFKSEEYEELDQMRLNEGSANIEADTIENESIPLDHHASNNDIDLDLPKKEIHLSGRRIVDMDFVLKQLQELNTHPKSLKCNLSDMVPVKEIKKGLRSTILFRCTICKYYQKVESCAQNDDSIGINGAATLGITSVGLGFYGLDEFCACIDLPCLSNSTFDKENKKLQDNWLYLAKTYEMEALREEIRLAILAGEIDSNGNAMITVICDGSWGKRSYGKGFSSLSGCAAIIGLRTKKVLYFGVKNKYCHICKMSYENIIGPPNDHECNINYHGPSSGMETEILIEGFKSCEKMGARFAAFISDGDSSFHKEIREMRLYKDPEVIVEKYECINHLFRNFRKSFKKLSGITKFKVSSRKFITETKGDDICKGIRMAATHWRESDIGMVEKLNNLERDCLNAPLHYFGIHDKCDKYFCNKKTQTESCDIVNLLKADGLFHEILNLCHSYFVSNVKSLLVNHTNNWAEEFNNVVAKYLGGKRINYSLAGSYTGRIAAAVVHYNSGGHGNSVYQEMFNMNSDRCLQLENKRRSKLAKNAKSNQIKPRQRRIFQDNSKTVRHGERCDPDKSLHVFEIAKKSLMTELDENKANLDIIETTTMGQKHNPKWKEIRRKLIDSSYFGRIINVKGLKSYTNLLDELMYKQIEFGKTAEMRHQNLYETVALSIFSSSYKYHELKECGLFIDCEFSFLCTSPLRLYGNDSLVIVKCPVKAHKKSFEEAVNTRSITFWHKNTYAVNKKCNWFIDIQGQLHITQRKYAYLVVWLGEDVFKIETVERDDQFWEETMKDKLFYFFHEVMAKELVDPRRGRKMKLREYNAQSNAFE